MTAWLWAQALRGIFTAIELTRLNKDARVLIIDNGRNIDSRRCPARVTGKCVHCKPCAIVSGWSGAGAFSDGKLSLSSEVGGHITDYIGQKEAAELYFLCRQHILRFRRKR